MPKFSRYTQQIVAHAEDAFPEECCGVIYAGKYIRLVNVDPEPEENFSISIADQDKYDNDPLTEAYVHSHPDGPVCPSVGDQKAQFSGTKPWVIVAHHKDYGWVHLEMGDHLLGEPLVGRPFCHAVFDCYSLVQAWFWQVKEIKLGNFVRQEDWWDKGENLYADNFEQMGFVELKGHSLSEALPGDCFLFKIDFKVEQHGLVYVGDGKVLHHLPNQLSREDAAEFWAGRASRWLRHKSLMQGHE